MQDLSPKFELPDGYVTLCAGTEMPVGFIPLVDHPNMANSTQGDSRGGYVYIVKVDNLAYVDWVAKHEKTKTDRP